MNYKHKYLKYKHKYLKLLLTMTGGNLVDSLHVPVADHDSGKLRLEIININDNMLQKLTEQTTLSEEIDNFIIKIELSTILVDKTLDDFNNKLIKLEILRKDKGTVISSICKTDNRLVNNICMNIRGINIFLKDYEITEDGNISCHTFSVLTTSGFLVDINGEIKSLTFMRQKTLKVYSIDNIKIEDCEITINSKKIFPIFIFIGMFQKKDYKISEHLKELNNKPLNLKTFQLYNILQLFYNNYVYHLTNNCPTEQLVNYGRFLKFLIDKDFDTYYEKIKNIHSNEDILQNIDSNLIKPISAKINNMQMEFKTYDGVVKFRNLPTKIKNSKGTLVEPTILFDSGNTGITVIGRRIVDILNLPINQGCFVGRGFGGKHVCNGYVELEYKFSGNNYDNTKEYKCVAMVNDDNYTDIIFGNKSGLYELFNDNYAIQYEYEKIDDSLYGQHNIDHVKQISDEIIRIVSEAHTLLTSTDSNMCNKLVSKMNEIFVKLGSSNYRNNLMSDNLDTCRQQVLDIIGTLNARCQSITIKQSIIDMLKEIFVI